MRPVDISGKRFGKLIALEPTEGRSGTSIKWKCLCDCGKEKSIAASSLTGGNTYSCGCFPSKFIDPNRQHKVCSGCKNDLHISNFGLCKCNPDGHNWYCKSCMVSRNKKYGETKSHSNSIRRTVDVQYRIKTNLRARLNKAIKNGNKLSTTVELLGCNSEYLQRYLESRFDENMSWDNYGTYWHIDHIRPCASFDLYDIEEQRKCFHYSNLQPLEKFENIRKGAQFEQD